MRQLHWYNGGQPQTLQLAQILLYLNAAFAALGALVSGGFVPHVAVSVWVVLLSLVSVVFVLGQAASAFGIANSRKIGYRAGVVCAFFPIALQLFYLVRYHVAATNLFSLLFEIALIFALLHPQSREYQRIWFK